jgi:hypothetical protein
MQFLARFTTAFCVVVGVQGTIPSTQPKQSDLVMVRGCLHGLSLTTLSAVDFDADPRVFQLTASRDLAAQLKQHTGHVEEVTGVLKAGKDTGATRVKEKRGAKGRVYGGFGTRTSRSENPSAVSTLVVRSVTHVQATCP